jgi:hypothetical protein
LSDLDCEVPGSLHVYNPPKLKGTNRFHEAAKDNYEYWWHEPKKRST